jgi:hypothetical protein
MDREEIIRMAREAGAMFDHMTWVERDLAPIFERFAALVAAAEREACARLCENISLEWEDQPEIAQVELATLMDCALAIRAKENT